MRTNEAVVITGKLGNTGGVTCSKVLYWRDGSGVEYDASWTNETVRIETSEDNYEYAVCTATGGDLTFATRGLDASTSKTSVASNIKEWRPGAIVKLVASASDIPDLDANNTRGGTNTFNGDSTFNNPVSVTESFLPPVYADATARDAAIPSPTNGMIIYNTAVGLHQKYQAGAWIDDTLGGAVPNGSETVAGKYEEGTQTQTDSGDATGETGADLVSTPQKIGRSAQKNAWIKGEDAGGDDAYVVTLTPAPSAYTDGMEILLKATTGNTGACSVNVNSLGVKSIKTPGGNDPQNGDIPAGKWKRLRYNGTDFVIVDGHQATTEEGGDAEMATDAEATTGTDETRYVNAKQLKNWVGYTVLADPTPLLQSADTLRFTVSATYVKLKEIVATVAGNYYVSFEMSENGTSGVANAQVFKNGVAFGTEQNTNDTSRVAKNETLTFAAGDLIQLYAKHTNPATGTYVRNFRLYGVIKPVSLVLTVNTN